MGITPALLGVIGGSGETFVYAEAAYFAGASQMAATVDKFAFSDDSRTSLGTGLSVSRWSLGAMANSGTAGYFGGGYASGYSTIVDKFTFSNDSRSTLGTGLSVGRYLLAGMANSGTAGYFGGGAIGVSPYYLDSVEKFAFSDDSRTTLGTGLSATTRNHSGMANSGTAGYFGGGLRGGGVTSTVDKFTFSDDSRSTLGTGLSVARRAMAGAADSGVKGYFAGGYSNTTSTWLSTVDTFTFSNDARSTLGTGLSSARYGLGGAAESGTAAYFAAGTTSSASTTTVDKFAFPADSRTTLATGLSVAAFNLSGMANSGTL